MKELKIMFFRVIVLSSFVMSSVLAGIPSEQIKGLHSPLKKEFENLSPLGVWSITNMLTNYNQIVPKNHPLQKVLKGLYNQLTDVEYIPTTAPSNFSTYFSQKSIGILVGAAKGFKEKNISKKAFTEKVKEIKALIEADPIYKNNISKASKNLSKDKDYNRKARTLIKNILMANETRSVFEILRSFSWDKAATKKDLIGYYQGLDIGWKSQQKEDNQEGILKDGFKLDSNWVNEVYPESFVKETTSPLTKRPEDILYLIDQQKSKNAPLQRQKYATVDGVYFPDCGATSLRNLLKIILNKKGQYDTNTLLDLGMKPDHPMFKYFTKYNRVGDQHSQESRDVWAKATSYIEGTDYAHEFCEITGGSKPMLHILGKIFNKNKESAPSNWEEFGKWISDVTKRPFDMDESNLDEEGFGTVDIATSHEGNFTFHFMKGHYVIKEEKKTITYDQKALQKHFLDNFSENYPVDQGILGIFDQEKSISLLPHVKSSFKKGAGEELMLYLSLPSQPVEQKINYLKNGLINIGKKKAGPFPKIDINQITRNFFPTLENNSDQASLLKATIHSTDPSLFIELFNTLENKHMLPFALSNWSREVIKKASALQSFDLLNNLIGAGFPLYLENSSDSPQVKLFQLEVSNDKGKALLKGYEFIYQTLQSLPLSQESKDKILELKEEFPSLLQASYLPGGKKIGHIIVEKGHPEDYYFLAKNIPGFNDQVNSEGFPPLVTMLEKGKIDFLNRYDWSDDILERDYPLRTKVYHHAIANFQDESFKFLLDKGLVLDGDILSTLIFKYGSSNELEVHNRGRDLISQALKSKAEDSSLSGLLKSLEGTEQMPSRRELELLLLMTPEDQLDELIKISNFRFHSASLLTKLIRKKRYPLLKKIMGNTKTFLGVNVNGNFHKSLKMILHTAIKDNDEELLDLLLNIGINIDNKDIALAKGHGLRRLAEKMGETRQWIGAIKKNSVKTIEKLQNKNPHRQNQFLFPLTEYARLHGHSEVARTLEKGLQSCLDASSSTDLIENDRPYLKTFSSPKVRDYLIYSKGTKTMELLTQFCQSKNYQYVESIRGVINRKTFFKVPLKTTRTKHANHRNYVSKVTCAAPLGH